MKWNEKKKGNDSGHICKLTLSWKALSTQIRIFLKAHLDIFFTWIGLPSGILSTHETGESSHRNITWTLGWFSNRTGTSVDKGKARGKDWTRLPVLDLLLCDWLGENRYWSLLELKGFRQITTFVGIIHNNYAWNKEAETPTPGRIISPHEETPF